MKFALILNLIILAISIYAFYSTTQLLKEYKYKYGKDFERFINEHK